MKRKLLPLIATLLVIILAGCAALAAETNKVENNPNTAQGGAQTVQTQPEAEKVEPTNTVDETKPAETKPVETKPAETKPATTTTKTKKSESAVKKIAFDHAKVKEANVYDLEISLDKDDSPLHYDISFESGSYDYDYDIDAYSGKILKSEKEKDSSNKKPATTTTTTTTKTKKTVAQVKKIALDHAKVKESATRDLEVELDKENGKEIYEITFESGGYDYEYDIDAYSGKILFSEKERDD